MKLFRKLSGPSGKKGLFGRSNLGDPWSQAPFWSWGGFLGGPTSSNQELLDHDFLAYTQKFYKDNGVVYACIQTRMLVFAEARFQFQRLRDGKPGDLFGSEKLKILENPWPGGQTGDLLGMMELDASIAGNSYWTYASGTGKTRRFGKAAKDAEDARLVRLRPDLVQIIIDAPEGDPWALGAKIAGYLYRPHQSSRREDQVLLMADEVAHYKPIPDPEARFRGMSWLTPIIREIQSDRAAMEHKKLFFEQGATLGHVISLSDQVGTEEFDFFVQRFRESHEGVSNAYKSLVLGGGADVSTVGADLRQLEFSQTQGHGETRIAAASGVPPVIVGLSEGLQAATYSNYSQARRRFADGTLRPLWRMAAAALGNLVDIPDPSEFPKDPQDSKDDDKKPKKPGSKKPTPGGKPKYYTDGQQLYLTYEDDEPETKADESKKPDSGNSKQVKKKPKQDARLWYDDRDIPFLRDDKKEEAEIARLTAEAARSFIEAGWEDESVKEFLVSRDPMVLKHTGMVSVQLLPPGSQINPMAPQGQPGATGGQPRPGGAQKPAQGAKPTTAKPAAKPAAKKPSQGGKSYDGD